MTAGAAAQSIVHVVAPGEFGGLETVIHLLARGQRSQGHRVCVCAVGVPCDPNHPFIGPLIAAGVDVECFEGPSRAYVRERAWGAGICRAVGATVVHTHGFRPDVIHGPSARALGIPWVSTAHGISGKGAKLRLYHWLQWRTLQSANAVVAVSRPLIDLLRGNGIPAGILEFIPNAYDSGKDFMERARARACLSLPEDCFAIGWVGRLSEEKGADVLLSAMALLKGHERVRAVMIGAGAERAKLERMAASLGITDSVTWQGAVRDAGHLFSGFDAFALTSRSEGTPMVLFEAMAAGVPIVATTVGGVPDVLSEREAFLVPPEDPPATASALLRLSTHPVSGRARVIAAEQRVRRDYGVDAWVQRHTTLYAKLSASSTARVTGAGKQLAASAPAG